MSSLRIAHCNLLNDAWTKNKVSYNQSKRIDTIANDILELTNGDLDVLYVCEGGSEELIDQLANRLNMQVVTEPYLYSTHDYMAFLVRRDLTNKVSVQSIHHDDTSSKKGMLLLEHTDVQLFGVHYPYRPIADIKNRLAFSKIITSNLQKPTIAMGDFNSLRAMASQQHLLKSGLQMVSYAPPPRTPNPRYHGLTTPHIVPSAVIDRIYHSKSINVSGQTWAYSDGTDHPILTATIAWK